MDWRILVITLFLLANAARGTDEGFCADGDDCGANGETESVVVNSMKSSQRTVYVEPSGLTLKAHFAMACFWGVEATFGCQPGVVRVRAGYMGGDKVDPTYKDLGDHTETVEVQYDPQVTTFSNLLKVFWKYHDYTAEYKTQYMSAIFYHDDEQKELAEKDKAEREANGEKVATKILLAKIFYKAEDYHQKYFLRQHKKLVEDLDISDEDFMYASRPSRLLCYIAGPGEEKDFDEEYPSLGLSEEQAAYIKEQMKTKKFEGCAP